MPFKSTAARSGRQKGAERAVQRKTRPWNLKQAGEIDYTFLVLVICVVAVGLVMLLSASASASKEIRGSSYSIFGRQLLCVVIGFVGMWFVSRINYNSYKELMPKAVVICGILLVLVLVPGIGRELNGSRRWLNTPIVQIQPSEFVKPVIAMYFAYMIEKGNTDLKTLRGNAPYIVVLLIIVALMLCETHLSGAIVIAGIAITVMIAGGTPVKPLIIGAVIILPIGLIAIRLMSDVRWERIVSFLHPFEDMQDSGYQVAQGIYAIGSGRLFGLGLGQSVQKYSYLPEPYNDFIFAIICEEMGFVGAVGVMALFAALILRGVRIAVNAPDIYGTLTATGIVAQLAIQTILNIAVATSSVPNTGVALPFFSYGGTSVMTLLFEMGVLLNISRYSHRK
ncbi:MAG TPA: putative lipid II flippase FtsW [Candidatus Ornithomonoglobus intestinigallinarum]|uniref:Probable peptidoglycan glycosyltransferase FtsW n=1 Tax=Candidatus Ornithomonoglobus intestinigallinarum TaxID=2840894 RepID=A0A9D1H3V4_9FIRM|nr:putative lipid II flippase FtsW [Candidatus Ornithomonoglobus intestinigallinarum]